jgi:hypothetical protein
MCTHFVDTRINLDLAKEWFTKYFEKYAKLVERDDSMFSNVSRRISTLGSPILGKIKLDEEFAQRSQIRGRRLPKSELDAYLDRVFVRTDERFEILSWWRTNANKYPILSAGYSQIVSNLTKLINKSTYFLKIAYLFYIMDIDNLLMDFISCTCE